MRKSTLLGVAAGLILIANLGPLLAAPAENAAKPASTIPNFAPDGDTGWVQDRTMSDDFVPPDHGPGPVTYDPKHPYVANNHMLDKDKNGASFRVADLTNPTLKPWAIAQMKTANDKVLAGGIGFTPKSGCWPSSTPGVHLLQVEPLYIVQTKDVVWLIWEFDNQVRRIYLNRPHSAHPTPSWYGESVGHYEGDTLVVDTVGITTKAFVDNYRTPHTDKLHVVERFHMINGGKRMVVDFTVDDPGTFNMAWSAKQNYDRDPKAKFIETICAENIPHYFALDIPKIPQTDRMDF